MRFNTARYEFILYYIFMARDQLRDSLSLMKTENIGTKIRFGHKQYRTLLRARTQTSAEHDMLELMKAQSPLS